MKRLLLFTLCAFLIAACLPRDMQMPQSPLLATLERKSGLIAYIGLDGNMYVSDQGGGKLSQLTDDALIPETTNEPMLFYQYPTWSRDGNQVAFMGLSIEGQQVESKIMVANVDDDSKKEIYSSDQEYPVYLNWSPDNATLTFISTNESQQRMLLQSVPAQGGDPTVLDAGSPYYWSWAPDGKVMVVHAGGATASAPEHIAFLQVDSASVLEQAVDSELVSAPSESSPSFQAPAWSPDGSRIALARFSEKENEILVTDAAGANPQAVGTFTAKAAFAWSHDSTHLAYIDGTRALRSGTIGDLHVVDLETSEEVVEQGDIIGFFWSPDSEEIAYFILIPTQPEEGSQGDSGGSGQGTVQFALELRVLDIAGGESRELVTYRPTQQFLNMLPYFDQYHQSATIWSPDNNNLVLSFIGNSGAPSIAIIPASGNLEPRILTQGFLAFWSWR